MGKWRNQVVIGVAVAVDIVVVEAETAVDKVPVGQAKPATPLVAVEPMPRQNASNWQVLSAVFPFAFNTPANK